MVLALINLASAQIKVVRETNKEINLGETLEVKISIFNNESSDKEAVISEQVSASAELVKPDDEQ